MHCFRVSVAGVLVSSPGWSRVRAASARFAADADGRAARAPRLQVTRCPCCCKKLRSKIPLRCENLDTERRQAVDVVEVRVAAPVRVWAVLLSGCSYTGGPAQTPRWLVLHGIDRVLYISHVWWWSLNDKCKMII